MVGLVLEQLLGWGGVGVSWVASRECTTDQGRALCGECGSVEEMRWVGVRGWWPAGGGALGPVGGLGLGLGASCVGVGVAVALGGGEVLRGRRVIRSSHHCCWCLWVSIHIPSCICLQCSSTRLLAMVSNWWISGLMSIRSLLVMRRGCCWVWWGCIGESPVRIP